MDFKVGEQVKVFEYAGVGLQSRRVKAKRSEGKIICVQDKFITVDTGRYKETYSYVDITLGNVKIERVEA